MVLLNDYEQKELQTREDLQKYLDFRKENDIWVEPFVNECTAVGADALTSKEEINKNAGINLNNDVVCAAMSNDTHLLLVFPYMFNPSVYIARYTAFLDICGRAGLYGRTIDQTEDKGAIKALPAMIKGQFLSTGFSLNGEICKILIRDEKISSMKSRKYQIFPEWQMVSTLEEHLKEAFPEYAYVGGMVSHEYLNLEYLLNATDMEDSFKLMLENMGIHIDGSIKCGIYFSTSDVGTSSVTVSPYCTINGVRTRLGKRVSVRHDTGNSIDDFKEVLKSVAASFQEAEDRVEELGNTNIEYPKNCFLNIIEAYKVIPKTEAKVIADELEITYPNGCNAMDIYLALNDIVERKAKSSTITQLINLQEVVAKTLWDVDFKEKDLPF